MRRLTALLALLALVTGCASGDGSTTTVEPDGENTTAETGQSLVLYSGRNENFVQPVIDSFTAETGIEVEVRYGGTGDLATTIATEGDTSPADVFWAQDPAFIGGLAKEGVLAPLPDDILGLVPERFSDSDGRWVGITGRARVLVHNIDLVDEAELPADIWALTGPEWEGRLGVAPTNGSFVAFVTGMVLAEGEDRTREWLEGIAANDPQIFDGNGPIVDAVVAGDLEAGLVNHYYLLQRIADLGDVPAANMFFPDGDPGSLVMAAGAGILSSSDQPDAGADLIRHLLTVESQEHFLTLFEYPLVEGVGAPADQPPLADLPTLDISLTDTADTLQPALNLIAESGLS
ncbi:MAG TPA: iron ABC transporter substrate-binding protein [Acidimicrobiia bacterium]|nr:iron ABC transporter substrate-binding protein [Acidimicrobiia bacterium]